MKRRISVAPASASSVLPVPIRADASHEVSTVRLASAAPIQTPGQTRFPSASVAASAMPEGGHTAVA